MQRPSRRIEIRQGDGPVVIVVEERASPDRAGPAPSSDRAGVPASKPELAERGSRLDAGRERTGGRSPGRAARGSRRRISSKRWLRSVMTRVKMSRRPVVLLGLHRPRIDPREAERLRQRHDVDRIAAAGSPRAPGGSRSMTRSSTEVADLVQPRRCTVSARAGSWRAAGRPRRPAGDRGWPAGTARRRSRRKSPGSTPARDGGPSSRSAQDAGPRRPLVALEPRHAARHGRCRRPPRRRSSTRAPGRAETGLGQRRSPWRAPRPRRSRSPRPGAMARRRSARIRARRPRAPPPSPRGIHGKSASRYG